MTYNLKCDLVTNALFYAPEPAGPDQISAAVATYLGLRMDKEEISAVVQQLDERGLVVKAEAGYVLSDRGRSTVAARVQQQTDNESRALEQWVVGLSSTWPDLDTEDLVALREDLLTFLKTLFIRHGCESIKLLSGEIPDDFELASVLDTLPYRSERLQQIRPRLMLEFLTSKQPDAIRLMRSILEQAVGYSIVVCDQKVLASLKKRLHGKKIYLDSNILYRFLGLQGSELQSAVESVVGLCRRFGLVLAVYRHTAVELRNRIEFEADILREYKAPQHLADVGLRHTKSDNFLTTFWRAHRETRIGMEDYISYYTHFENILIAAGIRVEGRQRPLLPEFSSRIQDLLGELGKYETVPYSKTAAAQEHDVYSILLTEQLQGTPKSFIDSSTWFLTADNSVIRFLAADQHYRGRVPVALTCPQLLQILRFVVPADEEFDKTFITVFSGRFIPTVTAIPNNIIYEITGRISWYGANESVAEAILSDMLFLRRYSQTDEEAKREEMIHDAIVEQQKHLLSRANTEIFCLTDKVKDQQKKIASVVEELRLARSQVAAVQEEAATRIRDLEAELAARQAESAHRKKIVLSILSLLVGVGQWLCLKWVIPTQSTIAISLSRTGLAMVLPLLVLVWKGKNAVVSLLAIAASIVGIFSIIYELSKR